ncbi:MAG TPA: SUMF1/EgtB/PvdO family nonheme iron enzyme [Thermotogota bacterium]|nr:SUMF1/EgtB/PvdO family nonheme iron enzyme [Thermotogota bacterium]
MKKLCITIPLLILIYATCLCQIPANFKMLNGDIIPCTILTPTVNLVTDYGEFQFETKYIKSIQFPEPGRGTTTLKTIFGEYFRGFITDEIIRLQAYGVSMDVRKAKVFAIELLNNEQADETYKVTVTLRNGDGFYANTVQSAINVQTSYSQVLLPFEGILEINFEGFGNVLTRILMKDGGVMQGIIKDEFIPLSVLSAKEIEIVPDMLKSIHLKRVPLQTSQVAEESIRISSGTAGDVFKTSQNAEMVLVTSGSFQMGNIRNENEGTADEKPIHVVTLTYDFWIGKYEVVYEDYNTSFVGASLQIPAVSVTWMEAIRYCNWLSEKEGLKKAYDDAGNLLDANGNPTRDITKVSGYRLPTEAEWEYAARGGRNSKGYKYSGSDNPDEVAWYINNSGNKVQEIGKKKANELGLFDMSGNVSEWCYDWFGDYSSEAQTNPIGPSNGTNRVYRGGSWYVRSQYSRVAFRSSYPPSSKYTHHGIRLVRTVF